MRVLLFGLGLGCLELLVNVAKFTAGRLRPHFLDACRPDVLCAPATAASAAAAAAAYVDDFHCTRDNQFAVFQSRLSFPSGHSSLAVYAAVFTVLYVERRVRWPARAVVAKTAFQALALLLAWFTALSRIPDHKHHWEDVLAGGVLGAVAACVVVHRVLRVHHDDHADEEGGGGGGSPWGVPDTVVLAASSGDGHGSADDM